jgi:hypothetical protein
MKMKDLFGRSTTDPGDITRLTGMPGDTVAPGDAVASALAPARPVPPASENEPSTPVPTRLQRLGAAIDRARPGRSGRNVRKWMETIGMSLIVFGFVCILLGWYGAAHSPYLYQEVPYLISGGLLGVALVIGGGIFVRIAWNMRQVEEDRRNALAIVRSVDRLERILRGLDETRRSEFSDRSEHSDRSEDSVRSDQTGRSARDEYVG